MSETFECGDTGALVAYFTSPELSPQPTRASGLDSRIHVPLFVDPNKVHPDPDIDVLIQLWKVVVRRPFNQFLDSVEGPAVAALLRNPQARQLAQATPYVLSDLSDEQIFRLAKPRFDKIDVVGHTESFAETVAMTCRKTGWELPPDFDRYNQNITEKRPVRDTIDKATRKRIELMSEVDIICPRNAFSMTCASDEFSAFL